MTDYRKSLARQLEQLSGISSVHWAAWLRFDQSSWQVEMVSRVNPARYSALEDYLHNGAVIAWLGGSLHTGRVRSRTTSRFAKHLGCQRVYSFADQDSEMILLVGADGLSSENQAFFRIYAKNGVFLIAHHPSDITEKQGEDLSTSRSKSIRLIHQVIQSVVGINDEGEIAQQTAELMAEYFGYEFLVILLADKSGKNLIITGIGGTKADLLQRGMSFPVSKGIIGRVYRTGQSYFSNNASADVDYFSIPVWEVGAEICIPLKEGEKVMGVINLERTEKESLSYSDQLVIESLGGILSSVIMNARRNKQLQEKITQLQAVRETALDISANIDLDILLKRVVHRVREIVGARGAEIGLVAENGQGIRVQTSENPWYDFSGHLIPTGKGIAGCILQTGRPMRVKDYYSWKQRLWPGTKVEFKAAAGVPLNLKGEVIGTLVVMDDLEGREFTDEEIDTLQMIAQNTSLAIHNAQLYKDLNESIAAHRRTETMLVQSDRVAAAGRLTASIAHEINNPLQALQNCLYLADHSDLDSKERQKYLLLARTELDRLNSTVQRMLDYYRPGVKDRQRTDLNELILRVIELLEPQLAIKGIETTVSLERDLPMVQVVPEQIQQVLINLMINAMEAMPVGGRITIQSGIYRAVMADEQHHQLPGESQGIEILVHDTGPGIPEDAGERIFEPFTSTKEDGIGLGLSVSYGIIQAHGGTLSLVSDGKPGACFRIALPEEIET